MKNAEAPVIISLGGSLIVPDEIDVPFLKAFRSFVVTEVQKGKRFVLIAGGGKTARKYQVAASAIIEIDSEDLDWLGIHATRLNAHLMRTLFRDIAHPVIITDPQEITEVAENTAVIVASGFRPGSSTDLRAIQIAKLVHATQVVNLSNIDYVYTADPKKNPDAKPIEKISWPEFRKLLPEKWDPGLSSPFDPVAAKEAEGSGIEVAIVNGNALSELENYIEERAFKGTLVH